MIYCNFYANSIKKLKVNPRFTECIFYALKYKRGVQMYTILELHKLLGVSRNTLYERLKTKEIQEFIFKDDKGIKLKKEGLNTLCALLGNTKLNKEETKVEQTDDKYVRMLEDTVRKLEERCSLLEQKNHDAFLQLMNINEKILETDRIYRLESLEDKKKRSVLNKLNIFKRTQ